MVDEIIKNIHDSTLTENEKKLTIHFAWVNLHKNHLENLIEKYQGELPNDVLVELKSSIKLAQNVLVELKNLASDKEVDIATI